MAHKLFKNTTFFAAIFALAIIGSYLFVNWPSVGKQIGYLTHTLPSPAPLEAAATLDIPKIKLLAPIVWATNTDPNELQSLLLNGIIHFPETGLPGEIGNGVYLGHSSNYWWITSPYNTVFSLLDKLTVGDEIVIHQSEQEWHYRVSEVKTVGKNSQQVFARPDETASTITLVTCWPNGTDLKKFFVRAVLVE